MYTFKTEILGVQMEITGTFTSEEPQEHDYPGCPAEFEIETVSHKGEDLEWEGLSVKDLDYICAQAFVEAEEDANEDLTVRELEL